MFNLNGKYAILLVASGSFFLLSPIYYFAELSSINTIGVIFITISTLLFSTLAGFFISGQTNRCANIIQKVTDFDGNISFLYRVSSCFVEGYQNKMTDIITEHYKTISKHADRDVYFNHKSNTLTNITNLVVEMAPSREALNPAESGFISRTYFALGDMQKIRKNLITLSKERIPKIQWLLLIALLIILITATSLIPSHMNLLASVIKSMFASATLAVLLILYKLNNLRFFEAHVGQSSAQDVIDIISGAR